MDDHFEAIMTGVMSSFIWIMVLIVVAGTMSTRNSMIKRSQKNALKNYMNQEKNITT